MATPSVLIVLLLIPIGPCLIWAFSSASSALVFIEILACINGMNLLSSETPLGVHVSRVRSLKLDDWCPEHVDLMMSIGNRTGAALTFYFRGFSYRERS